MGYEGGMTLGEIIVELEACDEEFVLNVGFSAPHSYRGYYECLGFEPYVDVTVGDVLKACREAHGATYEGYKGGNFTMGDETECYIAEYGRTGFAITKPILHGLLHNSYFFNQFYNWLYGEEE